MLPIERAGFGRDAWPRGVFLELHRDCRELFLVAKVNGRIAGYMVTCVEGRTAEVASLAVHPDYRRRGVADALMRHTLDVLAASEARRVELVVHTGNDAAARLYRSFGFRRRRVEPGYYDDGGDGIVMSRALK